MPDHARPTRTDTNRILRAPLAPEDTQIVIADLQQALIDNSQTRAADDITRSAVSLVRVAELLGLPYWFSVAAQEGTDPTLIEALWPYANQDNILGRVVKR